MFQAIVRVRLGCAREPGIGDRSVVHRQVLIPAELRTKDVKLRKYHNYREALIGQPVVGIN